MEFILKNKKYFFSLVLGIVGLLFIFALFSVYKTDVGETIPVAYSKDNSLYLYKSGKSPKLITDTMANDGTYNYYYVGWGVDFSSDGNTIYYSQEVNSDGSFKLFKKVGAKSSVLISENVFSYKISNNLDMVLYVKDYSNGFGTLCMNLDGKETVISGDIQSSESTYEISGDGSFVSYEKQENEKTALYNYYIKDKKNERICQNTAQFTIPSMTNDLFFIEESEDEEKYSIYKKTGSSNAEHLSDDVTALITLENNKNVLYYVNNGDEVRYEDIFEDDMISSDSILNEENALSDAQKAELESKKLRDEIRNEIDGKSIYGYADEAYIYSSGKSVLIGKAVIDAKVLEDSGEYIIFSESTGTEIDKIDKIKMSEISSTEDINDKYYEQARNSDIKTYLLRLGEEPIELNIENPSIQSAELSFDKSKLILFSNFNAENGTGRLVLADLKKDEDERYTVLGENITSAQFSETSNEIAFMSDFNNGVGTLNLYKDNKITVVSKSVNNYRFASDDKYLYYTDEYNNDTSLGSLKIFDGSKSVLADTNVFLMDYRKEGKFVYFKNFDMEKVTGDVYFFDKTPKLVDTDVKCLFFMKQ